MSKWIRQIHRWLAIAVTVTVIANFAAMTQGQPPAWVTSSPLLPLALLLLTGLYLFVLPYATNGTAGDARKRLEDDPWHQSQRAGGSSARETGVRRPWLACGR